MACYAQRASEIPAKFLLDCIYTIQTNNNNFQNIIFEFDDNKSHLEADDAESVFTQLNNKLKYDLAATIKSELQTHKDRIQSILSTPNNQNNAAVAATRQEIEDANNLLTLIESDYYRISLTSNDLASVETAPRRSPLTSTINVNSFLRRNLPPSITITVREIPIKVTMTNCSFMHIQLLRWFTPLVTTAFPIYQKLILEI